MGNRHERLDDSSGSELRLAWRNLIYEGMLHGTGDCRPCALPRSCEPFSAPSAFRECGNSAVECGARGRRRQCCRRFAERRDVTAPRRSRTGNGEARGCAGDDASREVGRRRLHGADCRTRKRRDWLVAPFSLTTGEAYFLVVSFIAVSTGMVVVSIIFMPVSIAAGAGAIAAPVSTGASSFLVHAASTSTTATSAMRFIV